MKKQNVTMLMVATVFAATGCYAKKKDVDAEFARVRQEMAAADQALDARHTSALASGLTATEERLGARIDGVARDVQRLTAQLNDLNVKVTNLNGLIAFDVPVHFDFGKAQLRDADRAVLKRFAAVVKEFYPAALITAEGYTDPTGTRAYNLKLGRQRADAVRQYLTTDGGLGAEQVRTVSYGEAANRLVDLKGKGPSGGSANRRVVLVFDYVGTAASLAAPVTN